MLKVSSFVKECNHFRYKEDLVVWQPFKFAINQDLMKEDSDFFLY